MIVGWLVAAPRVFEEPRAGRRGLGGERRGLELRRSGGAGCVYVCRTYQSVSLPIRVK